MSDLTQEQLAKMIDHAVLRPDATRGDLQAACEVARQFQVASLCVRPCDVAEAVAPLAGSGVPVGTVIGFPHGTTHSGAKVLEALRAIRDGAAELDMVVNVARLRDGDAEFVRNEIAAVVGQAGGRIVKVILECCYLDREQMSAGCKATQGAGAKFVKTSTGFGPGGATVQDVRFLREQVGDDFGVKASGGIRTLEDALSMIDAGANRIGTSRTEQILGELI